MYQNELCRFRPERDIYREQYLPSAEFNVKSRIKNQLNNIINHVLNLKNIINKLLFLF